MSGDQKLPFPTQPGAPQARQSRAICGIARFRLFHQPPLEAARVILVGAGVLVARLGAFGRIDIAADFDFEGIQLSEPANCGLNR